MTRREVLRMRCIETENKYLRETLERQMEIYRNQLYEIVALKTKIDLIDEAARNEE